MASIVSAGTTSATALNMSADTTGILQLASNNGTVAVTINTSQNVGIGTSTLNGKLDILTATDTKFVFQDGNTAGNGRLSIVNSAFSAYKPLELNATSFQFWANGVQSATLDASGNFGIGGTPTGRLALWASGAVQQYIISTTVASQNNSIISLCNSGAAYSAMLFDAQTYAFNTSGTVRLNIASNGVLTSLATYNNVSGGSPNMFVQTDGTIYRGTSALKYKQDVRDLELIDINKFRAVRYKSKCELDDQTIDYFGVIADEVDAAGVKELVTYGADGEVENFQYDRFTVVLLKVIQELNAKVTALEKQVLNLGVK